MESDSFEERKEIMQEVIDRHIKYGTKYADALKKLNAKFTIEIAMNSTLNPDSKIRVYNKPTQSSV